jgi:mercuric resistance transcriptional repressor protein MerD
MSAYTVSRLALDAGVSVHIVRDYLLRGLLRPVACPPGGYGLFPAPATCRFSPPCWPARPPVPSSASIGVSQRSR